MLQRTTFPNVNLIVPLPHLFCLLRYWCVDHTYLYGFCCSLVVVQLCEYLNVDPLKSVSFKSFLFQPILSCTYLWSSDFNFILLGAVSAMMPLAKQCAFEEPSVETITGENVLTWPHVVSYFNLVQWWILLCLTFSLIKEIL